MSKTEEIEDLLVCDHLSGLDFSWVSRDEVEQPYRELLCHRRDMTSSLARFHQGEVSLEIFTQQEEAGFYRREVLLRVGAKPVEYGMIRIFLSEFSDEVKDEILKGQRPLGTILNESGLSYSSRPGGFLRIPGSSFEPNFFPSSGGGFLFGRYNELLGPDAQVLARIIEILPREKS